MSFELTSEYAHHDPFRPLDWRLQRARCFSAEQGNAEQDDGWTRRAARFEELWGCSGTDERHRELARRRLPDVAAATEIHETGGAQVCELQARLLARQSSAEIAEQLNLDAAAVDAYEALFYCVRDRLSAKDYIWLRAIRLNSETDNGAVLRALGYFGGPLVVDVAAPYLLDQDAKAPAEDDQTGATVRLLAALLTAGTHGQEVVAVIEPLLSETTPKGSVSEPGSVFAGIVEEITDNVSVSDSTEPPVTTLETDFEANPLVGDGVA